MKKNDLDILSLYTKEIQQYPVLSEEELNALLERYHNGDIQAKEEIIKSNLRLVMKVARKYVTVANSMEFLDIVQEGNIGLAKCVEKYDSSIATFSTFAYSYIKGYIKRSINGDDKMIRRPHYLVELVSKYNKFIEEYKNEYSIFPSDDEIKEKLDLSDEVLYYLKNKDIYDVDSYNKKIENDGKELNYDEAVDLIADEKNQYDKLLSDMRNYDILNVIKDVLTDVEYYIFYYRFFSPSEKKTLQDIADEFNVTRQRIDQRIMSIRKKIKAYSDPDSLIFTRKVDYLKSIYNQDYYKLNIRPIEPFHICLFKYLECSLELVDKQILYIMLLHNVNYSIQDLAKIINVSNDEAQNKYDNIIKLLNSTIKTIEFQEYKNQMLEEFGYKLYNEQILSVEEDKEIRRILK